MKTRSEDAVVCQQVLATPSLEASPGPEALHLLLFRFNPERLEPDILHSFIAIHRAWLKHVNVGQLVIVFHHL
eukprot:3811496-Rhodomonas_salina.1